MTRLSPYDTRERYEAKPWISYTWVTFATPAEHFSKVDSDDAG